jgi:hypothetical protein
MIQQQMTDAEAGPYLREYRRGRADFQAGLVKPDQHMGQWSQAYADGVKDAAAAD